MKKLLFIAVTCCLLVQLGGCGGKKHVYTQLDTDYKQRGWHLYQDASGFTIYYPPSWRLIKGGADYIQIYNFDPNALEATQMFIGDMVKTEIHWQKLTENDLQYFPEIRVVKGVFSLNPSAFTLILNGEYVERWTGRDVLRQAKKIMVYDQNAVRETDLSTEIVTRNMLFQIDTYTSGEENKVPTTDILLLHNSFSF